MTLNFTGLVELSREEYMGPELYACGGDLDQDILEASHAMLPRQRAPNHGQS